MGSITVRTTKLKLNHILKLSLNLKLNLNLKRNMNLKLNTNLKFKVQRNRNNHKEYPVLRNIPIPFTRIGIGFKNILLLFYRIGIDFLNIMYVQNVYRNLQNMPCNI